MNTTRAASSWKLTDASKRDLLARLRTEFLYVLFPLLAMICIRIYQSDLWAILLAPDWSLASCVVFGQVATKMSRTVARRTSNADQYAWYTAKRFFWVFISLLAYCGMVAEPSLILGALQLALFGWAAWLHFVDGVTAEELDN